MQVVFAVWRFMWKTGNVATLQLSVCWCDFPNFLPDFYSSWWVCCRLSVLAAGSNGQDNWNGTILLVFSNVTISQPDDRLNVPLQVLHMQEMPLILFCICWTTPSRILLMCGCMMGLLCFQNNSWELRAMEVKHTSVWHWALQPCNMGNSSGSCWQYITSKSGDAYIFVID